MSTEPSALGNLINRRKGMRYEFLRGKDDSIIVHRVWLSDNEREYMGRYDNAFALEFWNGLIRDGFTKEQ
jgi:hypothetical protein